VVFSLDPGALHRPLGVAFGARGAAGAAAASAAEPLASGWIGVELPRRRASGAFDPAGAGERGAPVALALPPPELCGAAGRVARERLRRSGATTRGLLLAKAPASESEVAMLSESAARAAGLAADELLVLARPAEVTLESSARASARGVIDGMRVSLLGLAAGRPLPRRSEPLVALLLTDAALQPATLERLLNEVALLSFGTVAGLAKPARDDALVALATGVSGGAPLEVDSLGWRTLKVGAVAVAQRLVRQLLERSADGAVVLQLTVSGAASDEAAAHAAESLALSLHEDAWGAELRRALVAPKGRSDVAGLLAPRLAAASITATALRSAVTRRAGLLAWRIDLGSGAATATRWSAIAPG
jgi:hypothetical protein